MAVSPFSKQSSYCPPHTLHQTDLKGKIQYQKLVQKAKALQIPIQQVIRNATSIV